MPTLPCERSSTNSKRDGGNEGTKNRRKVRRSMTRKNACNKFKVLMNNIRGFKSKAASLRRIISEENPVIVAITETKLSEEEDLSIPNYIIARVDRTEDGGGVL